MDTAEWPVRRECDVEPPGRSAVSTKRAAFEPNANVVIDKPFIIDHRSAPTIVAQELGVDVHGITVGRCHDHAEIVERTEVGIAILNAIHRTGVRACGRPG